MGGVLTPLTSSLVRHWFHHTYTDNTQYNTAGIGKGSFRFRHNQQFQHYDQRDLRESVTKSVTFIVSQIIIGDSISISLPVIRLELELELELELALAFFIN